MCGIAGHLAFPLADPAAAERMGARLAHRGPDGEGRFHDGPIALAHRRLSIIDLHTGAQPMRSADGKLTVAFNGEIYNYRELRQELGLAGFRTQSDTEVLLQLYAAHGEAMLPRLRGMFAFALWDAGARRLLLARDRAGEKPLLYAQARGGLYFASELGALREGAGLHALDRRALAHYLELLYVPSPRTLVAGCKKLPPGHLLVADEKGLQLRKWHEPPAPGSGKAALGAAELAGKLSAAVRLQLRSDVPVAALLSGGLDSSAVVALAAQELQQPLRTYAVGFGQPGDELPAARLVAERFHTDHRELVIDDQAGALCDEAFAAFTEPCGDSSAVPTCAVMREVAREVKVVLTGDGGDELFCGYDRYRLLARMANAGPIARVPGLRGRAERLCRLLGPHGEQRYRGLVEVFSAEERRGLLGETLPAAPQSERATHTDVDAALAFDLSVYLPDDLLFKVDTAAMRWGLEARAPLLDADLLDAVVPGPDSIKQDLQFGKLQLRSAVGQLLPEPTLRRPKQGFGAPVGAWLRGPLGPRLHDLVASPRARVRDWLDDDAIDEALELDNPHQAWALLALEEWARRHL